MLPQNLLTRLSENFENLLKNPIINYDMIINVGKEPNKKIFYAHSFILIIQSTYFETALSNSWIKSDGDKIVFNKPNISPKIFGIILKHLYSGTVSIKRFTPLELLELLSAADEFLLPELMEFTETYLLTISDSWSREEFIQIYLHSHKITQCVTLQEFCMEHICKYPYFLFKSRDFVRLNEDMFIKLLKRVDLRLEDVELWIYTVKWGLHRSCNNLSRKSVERWNDEDFKELWEILKNCVRVIRFSNLSVEEFSKYVKPYAEMFPRKMYETFLWNYINPQAQPIMKEDRKNAMTLFINELNRLYKLESK